MSTVMVPLTVEQRAERAEQMARLVARIEGVEAEAKEHAAEAREEIKGLEAELRSLAKGVREGLEERAQMDLFVGQAEAVKHLTEVGEKACSCEGGPEAEVKSPACPVHGVENRGENPAPCDGVHGQDVACADPKCWLIEGPAEEAPQVDQDGADIEAAELAEAEADDEPQVEREDGTVHGETGIEVDEVETIKPEEPAAVANFRAEKARRRKRA